MKEGEEENHFNTVFSLRDEYRERINVFAGLEPESRINGEMRPQIERWPDYVHIFRTPEDFFSVDSTPEEWRSAFRAYGGNALMLIENQL